MGKEYMKADHDPRQCNYGEHNTMFPTTHEILRDTKYSHNRPIMWMSFQAWCVDVILCQVDRIETKQQQEADGAINHHNKAQSEGL